MNVFAGLDEGVSVGKGAVLQVSVYGLNLLDFLIQGCNAPFFILRYERSHLLHARFVGSELAFSEIANMLEAWVMGDLRQ